MFENDLISPGSILVCFLILILFVKSVRIIPEYQRAVIFRLGHVIGLKGPGLIVIIPEVDRLVRVDLRPISLIVPPQELFTRDNKKIRVSTLCNIRVVNPVKSVVEIVDFKNQTNMLSQSAVQNVLGEIELDELKSNRREFNQSLLKHINRQTERWGVEVTSIEIKDVEYL